MKIKDVSAMQVLPIHAIGAMKLEESVLLAMANINHANVKMTEKYGRNHLVEKDSILKNAAIPALTTYLNHAVE